MCMGVTRHILITTTDVPFVFIHHTTETSLFDDYKYAKKTNNMTTPGSKM